MGFNWPLGLAALAAVVVPILIHLARRRPRRPVLVGTLRHLPGVTAPRRARSRIIEPWLLAIRVLVLISLALFVAQPFLRGSPPAAAPRSLLVLPSGIPDDSLRGLVPAADSLLALDFEVRRLPMADLWSEIAELDAGLPDRSSIVVVAPLVLPVAGTRPAMRSAVTLHRFERAVPVAPPESMRVLHVRIVADSSSRSAALRHAAAFRAVAELRGDSLVLNDAATRGWIVWLADSAPPPATLESVRAGATLLIRSVDGQRPARAGSITAEPLGRGRIIATPAVGAPAIDASFPELVARLWPEPAALVPTEPELRRVSTDQLLPTRASGPERRAVPRMSFGNALLGLALALFLFERWLSHRPTATHRA